MILLDEFQIPDDTMDIIYAGDGSNRTNVGIRDEISRSSDRADVISPNAAPLFDANGIVYRDDIGDIITAALLGSTSSSLVAGAIVGGAGNNLIVSAIVGAPGSGDSLLGDRGRAATAPAGAGVRVPEFAGHRARWSRELRNRLDKSGVKGEHCTNERSNSPVDDAQAHVHG